MQARHRYVAILAAVAVVILVVGFLLRPTPPPSPTKRAPAEVTVTHAELDNLRDLVQRNSLRNVAADFSALVSPGVFSGMSDARCGPFVHRQLQTTIPLTPTTIGAGVFDLTGGLQGIVAQCDDSISILGIGDIQRALTDATSATLLARYGMRLSTTPATPPPNSASAVLVGELWAGWPADAAGLQAGDALLNINGQATAGIDQTVAALTAQNTASFRLQVRRGQRIFVANMKPVQIAAPDAAPPSALELQPDGMRLLHVAPGSSAAAAGIRSDDILLRVADLPATSARVNRVLGSYRVSAPVSAVIWRPGRELLVWIQP